MNIGIITIHKINNYGSVFQAYALQQACELFGHHVEIIDYRFPNSYQSNVGVKSAPVKITFKDKLIKLFYAFALLKQHKGIASFVKSFQHLSRREYVSPEDLENNAPIYDVYLTGSDQLWNPNYCCGDPSFFLKFVSSGKCKVAYAASFGVASISKEFVSKFKEYLMEYESIGVRENTGVKLIEQLTGRKDARVVLDPTLLLDKHSWNKIAVQSRIIKEKYILCYFLNYSFDSFPYVDELASHIQKITGYKLVKVARPPRNFYESNTYHCVGASPEEFLALMRDAEFVITTSFHGTAFAVNFEIPFSSVVADKTSGDSRQISLLDNVGLSKRIIEMGDNFPNLDYLKCDFTESSKKMEELRNQSINFLKTSIENGI